MNTWSTYCLMVVFLIVGNIIGRFSVEPKVITHTQKIYVNQRTQFVNALYEERKIFTRIVEDYCGGGSDYISQQNSCEKAKTRIKELNKEIRELSK